MDDDLERYEDEAELQLYREYRDVMRMFRYAVETDRRFYLANEVTVTPHEGPGGVYFEVLLEDAWVWDVHRPTRMVPTARVWTFGDVNLESITPTA